MLWAFVLNRSNGDSSPDALSYVIDSDLNRFDGDPVSEVAEVVGLGFLKRFAVPGGVVDNSLKFSPVKSCWHLVARCAHNDRVFEKRGENERKIK